MPQSRIVDRLGIHMAAQQFLATAVASQTVASTQVATVATSNIIDTWTVGDRRYLANVAIQPLTTAATGAVTVGVYHGTATGSMSAASVGTGTVAMQQTANVASSGSIIQIELQGSDLVGKNRYLQFRVTPGGGLIAQADVQVFTEPRYLSPTNNNVAALATTLIVSDLS